VPELEERPPAIAPRHRLEDLPVLLIDCQATASSPERGHLLEVGWCRARASDAVPEPDEIRSHLVGLPRGSRVPPQITRLTGIANADMTAAIGRTRMRSLLAEAAAGGSPELLIAVAHYARFEQQFLDRLFAGGASGPAGFPLPLLCTHEIARRLLPHLPRRGLRALAGYFGHPVPERKRASCHVLATARIWSGLVRMLRDRRSIDTLEKLLPILDQQPPARGPRFSYPLPRKKRLGLSAEPGVYRFLGGGGDVLYVGKAGSLKHRVNSYYRKRRAEEKLLELVSQARDVEVSVTATRVEAALLEVDEIKRLDPPYNKALRRRDSDLWFLTEEMTDARSTPDGKHLLGPFPDQRPLLGLMTLSALARGQRRASSSPALSSDLGLDQRRIEPGALAAGIHRFMEEHAEYLRGSGRSLALLSLGAELLRNRLAEEVEAEPEVERPDAEDAGAAAAVDADGVVGHLEELVLNGARLARRARWLALLIEAAVSWRPITGRESARRVLLLRRGRVLTAATLAPGAEPPFPRDPGRRRRERLEDLDRATYDRLSVLSSEIKRLCASQSGTEVRVILGPGRTLDQGRLSRLMRRI
jgi:DNA polymerase-3 subunit epsilon